MTNISIYRGNKYMMYIIAAFRINSITLLNFSKYCVSIINMQVKQINLQFAKNYELLTCLRNDYSIFFDVDKGGKRGYNF